MKNMSGIDVFFEQMVQGKEGTAYAHVTGEVVDVNEHSFLVDTGITEAWVPQEAVNLAPCDIL